MLFMRLVPEALPTAKIYVMLEFFHVKKIVARTLVQCNKPFLR